MIFLSEISGTDATSGDDQSRLTCNTCAVMCCAEGGHAAHHRSSGVSPLCRRRRSGHESHSAIPRTIGHLVTHGLFSVAGGGRVDAATQLLTSAHVTHTIHQGILLRATRVPRYVSYPLGTRLDGKLYGYPRCISSPIPIYRSEYSSFILI